MTTYNPGARVIGTSKFSNREQFGIALKAAAWEANRMPLMNHSLADLLVAAQKAGRLIGVIEERPAVNVDPVVIAQVISTLAFTKGSNAFFDGEIDRAWAEYAGMGTKALAAANNLGPDFEHTSRNLAEEAQRALMS
jgi:hypothetical protein